MKYEKRQGHFNLEWTLFHIKILISSSGGVREEKMYAGMMSVLVFLMTINR